LKIGKTKGLTRSDCDLILDFCAMEREPGKYLIHNTLLEDVFRDFEIITEEW